MSILDNFWMLN